MVSVHDVAAYILGARRPLPVMKLHKLVYYSQAWHLAWSGAALFHSPFHAWANGPACPELYERHRGVYLLDRWPAGDARRVAGDEADTVDVVLASYGPLPAETLSEISRSELPWRAARAGLGRFERGASEMSPEVMAAFYRDLGQSDDAVPVAAAFTV